MMLYCFLGHTRTIKNSFFLQFECYIVVIAVAAAGAAAVAVSVPVPAAAVPAAAAAAAAAASAVTATGAAAYLGCIFFPWKSTTLYSAGPWRLWVVGSNTWRSLLQEQSQLISLLKPPRRSECTAGSFRNQYSFQSLSPNLLNFSLRPVQSSSHVIGTGSLTSSTRMVV